MEQQQGKAHSLVSKVMDRLVSGIVEERYNGILPPQDVLSREFDVSRTVMREALSMLLARDMLDVRPKVGTRVRPMRDWRMIDEDVVTWRFRAKPDPQFMRDVLEFRMLIEPRAANQAASRASRDEVEAIRAAFERMADPSLSDSQYEEADELLHTHIMLASGNQFLQQMATIVRCALRLSNQPVIDMARERDAIIRTHGAVVRAIEQRDPEAAEQAMRELIDHTADALQVHTTQLRAGNAA